MEQAYFG
jgi:hypothetical protein